jgi:uncharacterized RDD family membrane protein YckC
MAIDNDPFDEFEFKPLTSGLGFHKKSEQNTNVQNTPIQKNQTLKNISQPKSQVQYSQPKMTFSTETHKMTAPKVQTMNIPNIEDDSIFKAQSAVNEILKNLNHKKQVDQNKKTKINLDWKATSPSLAAALLDSLFVISLFLVCMISALTITKVDLISQLSNSASDPSIWIATSSLFLSVYFIYMTLFRTYMGSTPGEWAFDQRCGKDTDQASSSYVFKLILRHMIVGLTGFLPLALISWILKYDLTGTLINLPVQKRT